MLCHDRHLGFDLMELEIAPFDPPTLKTLPYTEPNMKWIGSPFEEIWPLKFDIIIRVH